MTESPLADLQRQINSINPYYCRMFVWSQNGSVIKAKPRQPLSEVAFQTVKKVFKRFGGHYVRLRGTAYFELVADSPVKNSAHMQFLTSEDMYSRMETQIRRLVVSGQQLEGDKKQ